MMFGDVLPTTRPPTHFAPTVGKFYGKITTHFINSGVALRKFSSKIHHPPRLRGLRSTSGAPWRCLKLVPASKVSDFWTREFFCSRFPRRNKHIFQFDTSFGAFYLESAISRLLITTPEKLSWLAGKFQPWRFVSPIKNGDFPAVAMLFESFFNQFFDHRFPGLWVNSRTALTIRPFLTFVNTTRGFVSDPGRKSLFKVWRSKSPSKSVLTRNSGES